MAFGILCLETYWSSEVSDRSSVAGLLTLLEDNSEGLLADHRHVADRGDFEAYLTGAWPWDRYDLLYIAAHGDSGAIADEDGTIITLRWLAARIKNKCRGRVVYLSGCRTADISDAAANRFLAETKAAALVGYTKDVDWLRGAQMDLLLLGAFADNPPDATGSWDDEAKPAAILEQLQEEHEVFAKALGWHYFANEREPSGPRRAVIDGLERPLDDLLAVAQDDSLLAAERVKAVKAAGQLGVWRRGFADLARSRKEPLTLRRAAARTMIRIDSPSARSAVQTLTRRLKASGDVDDRKLLGTLGTGGSR